MQARGGSVQNQQNQNPNVGALAATSSTTAVTTEVKANMDSVLEISMDKRNAKNNNRGGKRKRINMGGVSQEEGVATTSAIQ
jgi:hypothetical protein